MICLGDFTVGEEINVTLVLKDTVFYLLNDEPLFWYIDMAVYEESFKELAKHQLNITDWSDTYFIGNINVPADRTTVFTSLPYDANWRAWVDGSEVKVYETLDALVAFNITEGDHEVVIKYVPKQLYIGLCITAVSMALLLAIFFIDRATKKKRMGFEVELVEIENEETAKKTNTKEENE